MKKSVAYALLASPILLAAGISAASAASPAYCALYAREYASARIGTPTPGDAAGAMQRVEDQAYYRCLNQDEAPQFPTTSAYFGAPLDDITGVGTDNGGPFQALQGGSASAPAPSLSTISAETAPATQETPEQPKAAAKPVQVASNTGTRGAPTRWTPEWVTWCKAHYRSFDEKTGYVLTLNHQKKMCP